MHPRKRKIARRRAALKQGSSGRSSGSGIEAFYEESFDCFICKICDHATQTERGIKRHLESKHEGEF